MSLKRELDRIVESANQIIIAAQKIGNSDKLAKNIAELGLRHFVAVVKRLWYIIIS